MLVAGLEVGLVVADCSSGWPVSPEVLWSELGVEELTEESTSDSIAASELLLGSVTFAGSELDSVLVAGGELLLGTLGDSSAGFSVLPSENVGS